MGRKRQKEKVILMNTKEKTILIILDGWGIKKTNHFNAITHAKTPNFNKLWKDNPHTTLFAAESYVGLPQGFMGNSEVGHLHLGAGRLIQMELKNINNKIKDKSFFANKIILKAMKNTKKHNSTLHLMGLVSDGGVHSHINHLFALLKMAKQNKVKNVLIHCFLDGRDTPPKNAKKYIKLLEKKCKTLKIGKIATIIGRFYAMDRDNRWYREHMAYTAIVNGQGYKFNTAIKALSAAYKRGETDEFIKPSIIINKKDTSNKKKIQTVEENDSIIFFNFRSDRARELTRAFVDGKFHKFKRKEIIKKTFVCLTQYDKKIKADVAFPPHVNKNILGEIISKNNLRQLRIAETEKYAHVTFFFNSGRDGPFPKEDRLMIPSPKVKTYDSIPQMSCLKITKTCIKKIKSKKYPLIVLNYANPDMVGHTGNFKAAVNAIEHVDAELGKLVNSAKQNNYNIIITADHGNAEEMIGIHKTSHTTNKVPCIFITNKPYKINKNKNNSIANIAPTILTILGLKPQKIHSNSLLK